MSDYKIISGDDHVFEPPDLWTDRIAPKFKDRAPHILRLEDGADYWVCEDRSILGMSAGSQSGVRLETPEKLNLRDVFENVRPGGYDPDERIKDMDLDGVDISLIYTSAGLRLFNQVRDGELLTAIFAAYNDWLAEFCQPFPSRLKGVGMVNVDNVEEAIAELQRCAKLGFAGAMISAYPKETRSYNMPEYEPLWAAAQDLDMPISLHVATNRGSELASSSTVLPAHNCTQAYWVQVSIAHMIYTGVFERYPRLQIGAVEAELSWAPHFIDRLDYTYTQRAKRDNWYVLKEDMLPSDYFHRNVFIGFQEDALGVRLREFIGVDSLTWGSDYPHHESTFPKSRQILDEILSDCTEEEKAKIAGGNTARIYHLS